MTDPGSSLPGRGATADLGATYVSTGHLPRDEWVREAVAACHAEVATVDAGRVSTVYPALAQADPSLFGIAVIGVDGHEFVAGDVDVPFALMSVAKPFVFALACARLGVDGVVDHIGVDATGRPFNSLAAVEHSPDGRTNPMVNSGAIACTGLFLGRNRDFTVDAAWDELRAGLSAFAGRDLSLDDGIHDSARATNQRNRALGSCCTLSAASTTRMAPSTCTPGRVRWPSPPETSPSWGPRSPTGESTPSRASPW